METCVGGVHQKRADKALPSGTGSKKNILDGTHLVNVAFKGIMSLSGQMFYSVVTQFRKELCCKSVFLRETHEVIHGLNNV